MDVSTTPPETSPQYHVPHEIPTTRRRNHELCGCFCIAERRSDRPGSNFLTRKSIPFWSKSSSGRGIEQSSPGESIPFWSKSSSGRGIEQTVCPRLSPPQPRLVCPRLSPPQPQPMLSPEQQFFRGEHPVLVEVQFWGFISGYGKSYPTTAKKVTPLVPVLFRGEHPVKLKVQFWGGIWDALPGRTGSGGTFSAVGELFP